MRIKDLTRKQKNVLIGFLLAIVLVMAVGYAAFSKQLNISNTAQIDSKWDVEITDITANKTATCSDSEDITTCSTTGNVAASYDNSNGLTATFSAALVSPGDFVTYTIEISNLGTLNAQLASIDLPEQSDPNITYVVNQNGNGDAISGALTTNSILNKKDTSPDKGYVYVTVKYNSYSGQETPTGNAATVSDTIRFNFVQTTNSAPAPAFTGTIYRNNSNALFLNHAINENLTIYYPSNEYTSAQEAFDDGAWFLDETACTSSAGGECSSGTITLSPGDYVTSNPSSLGKYIYLKHTVVNDIVTASYVCFTYTGSEVCLQGGVDECLWDDQSSQCTYSGTPTVFPANVTEFDNAKSWFTSAPQNGSCDMDEDSYSQCFTDNVSARVELGGIIQIGFQDNGCEISDYGESVCWENS